MDELAHAYQSRTISSFHDIPKSGHQEMETLYELGGVELINKVMHTALEDFRFGLPVPNVNPGFKNIEQLAHEYRPLPNTPVENLMTLLEIEHDCSYEAYEGRLQERFGFAAALGDEHLWESDAGVALLKRELEVSLPIEKLKNEKYMRRLRNHFQLNLNLPGCLGEASCRGGARGRMC